MVIEQELQPYLTWLLGGPASGLGALYRFVLIGALLGLIALAAGFFIALVRYGPLKGGDLTYRVVVNGFAELAKTSGRRVWALARLAIKESMRRRVAVALGLYFLILLFAGWFLHTSYQDPSKLLMSFVLSATTYLVLLIALLTSTFSLPQDFKTKTIYTVVTKPVRAGDVVLGRILGFTLVGTALLTVMGVFSYIFVVRTLHHTHTVDFESLEAINDANGNVLGQKGRTTLNQFHRHEVEISAEGQGVALSTHGHEHEISAGADGEYEVSGPIGMLRARVPYYGKLRFVDRQGVEVPRGISVGSEWTYRSFIEGGSSAAAIWTLEGIDESVLRRAEDGSQYLPMEIIVRVFRTYKGDIERGIQGSVQLRNPDPESTVRSDVEIFTAKDDSVNEFIWPRKLYGDQQELDLMNDLVSRDGRLEVWVQCLDRAQYYGFAQPDCYVRLPDGSPLWNFCKSLISIWVQMVLVIAIGVTCSTIVNGPVAMMFTVSFLTLGLFRDFFVRVATGEQVGGGPVESLVRLVTQKNLTGELEGGLATHVMHAVDYVLQLAMISLAYVLPDFRSLSSVAYVAYGYNIPMDRILQDLTVGAAYVVGSFVIGYFFLRTREVAK